MRRDHVSAAVLALLLALAGGSLGRGEGDSEPPPGDSDPLADRPAVLIYHGHGGVGPEGLDGSMTHEDSRALLEGAGLEVDQQAAWPASFDAYRLVILPAPGAHDAQAMFSTMERAELGAVAATGGALVVECESGSAMNLDVVNGLVWDLGLRAVATGIDVDGIADGIAEHALTDGVGGLGLSAAVRVDPGDTTCLASSGGDCVAAATAAGDGWIVLIGDGDLLSWLDEWVAEGQDNDLFLRRLAQIP